MNMIALFAAALFAVSARGAQFSAYDGSFALSTTDRWNVCDVKAFASSTSKPALCLLEVTAGSAPPTLLILDIALNQAYEPGSSLEVIARRDLAMRRKKQPSAKLTPLKPVRFRTDLDGFGLGMLNGGIGWDTFYFALGPKRYFATCRGDVEKDCLAALSTIRSEKESAPKTGLQGPRVVPKSWNGISFVVPPGWTIREDTSKLFLMLGQGESFQLRTPLLQTLLPDDPSRLAGAIQGGIKLACSHPVEGPSSVTTRTITSERSQPGTLAYATCRDSAQGYLLSGVLSVGAIRKFLVVQSKTQDPTSRALEVLSSLETAH